MGYFGSSTYRPSGWQPVGTRTNFTPPDIDAPPPTQSPFDPTRPSANGLLGEGVNIVAAAGRAPGYVAERPLAWLNTATKGPGQEKGVIDQGLDFLRSVPILGTAMDVVGGALTTPWAAKVGNAPMASALAATVGMSDDDPLPQNIRALFGPNFLGIPGLSTLGDIGEVFHGQVTVGELRQNAYARGFAPEDAMAVAQGQKSQWDFETAGLDANPLANIGLQMGFDPTNLLLGAGAVAKLPRGLGMAGKFFNAFGKPIPKSFETAVQAFSSGRNLMQAPELLTYQGTARLFASLGRGTSLASKAYFRTALGMTGAELGLTAAGDALDNTPLNPLMEPLADFARRAQQNQPLSNGHIFSLVSAFKFPYHDTVQGVRTRMGQAVYRSVGSNIIPSAVDTLVPGNMSRAAKTAKAHEMFGGKQSFEQYVERVLSSFAHDKAHKFLKGVRPESEAELEAILEMSGKSMDALLGEMLRNNEISGSAFVERLKEIASNSREVSDLSGGLRFNFNPDLAASAWREWRPWAARLAQMFEKRSPVVVGLMRDQALPKEWLSIARGELEGVAEANGGIVPKAYLNKMVHDRLPQLLRDEPFRSYFGRFLTKDGPDGDIAELSKMLKEAEKNAPPLRDFLYEVRDWEKRHEVAAPFQRVYGRDATVSPAVTGVEVSAPAHMASQARAKGMRSVTLDDARRLRSGPVAQAVRTALPRALDEAGYNIGSAVDQVGYSLSRGELVPEIKINFTGSNALMQAEQSAIAALGGGSKRAAYQGHEVEIVASAAEARAGGFAPNAIELTWTFGRLTPEQANALAAIVGKAGRESGIRAVLDDTNGVLRLRAKEAQIVDGQVKEIADAIANAVPEHPTAGKMKPSREAIYMRTITNDARRTSFVGDEVLSNARRAVESDPRYVGAVRYLAEYRGAVGDAARSERASLRRAGAKGRAEAESGDFAAATERVSAVWADVESAPTPEGVDRFLQTLNDEVDPRVIPEALSELRTAVEMRYGTNPVPPAMDDALLRAHEDFVGAGGNQGQVLFNASLDAVTDTLPRFDNSLTNLPDHLKQELADFQRDLVVNSPYYTLKSPPLGDVPYVYSRDAGSVLDANMRRQSEWAGSLFAHGPASVPAKFVNMLFRPRTWKSFANKEKQEQFNWLLNAGATVAEINGYVAALKIEATTQRSLGVKIVRGIDAMYPSVYEDIATGAKFVGERGDPAAFRGFSDEVIAKVGKGNFWKGIDRAASDWWRNIVEAAEKPGVNGAVGRMLEGLYPKGMGIRHYGKIWYHAFRFLTDPRWWAMNKLEADVMFASKYGTMAMGAKDYVGSRAALTHALGEGHEAVKALDELAAGWFDNRALLGPMTKAFDAEAPRTVQRYLDSLPETHPITQYMVERFGKDVDKTWGQALIDDVYSFDMKGVKKTVEEEAAKIFSADEYDQMERLGILQKVWELNERTWGDIQSTIRGNPNRSQAERILNSYWLYWPLSYQLKAGKWMYDTLSHKAFGKKSNLLGAWEIDHLDSMHKEKMLNDPAYAAMFTEHPETWFFAQMFFPITPFDMGVSLSPAAKAVGGSLGWWDKPSYANDPISLATRMAQIGPVFTISLLRKVNNELKPFDALMDPFKASPETQTNGFRWGH